MRPINVFLSILFSAGLFFGILELGLRLFPAFRHQPTLNQFDPTLGWSKEPGKVIRRSTPEFSIEFAVSDQGLRDDPVAVPKPAGTYRVVCLGDSFVLGYTVDRGDLFVDLLERAWSSGAARVEVVNGGTEGWSTDQQVLWHQEHGAALQPDLVLLFPYENDLYWNGQASYYRFPKPRFQADGRLEPNTLADPGSPPLLQRLALGRALGLLLSRVLPYANRPHTFDAGDGRWLPSEFAPLLNEPPAFLEDALARTRGALSALKEAAGSVPVLVCPLPSESAIQPDSYAAFQKGARGKGMAGLASEAWSPNRPVELFLGMAQELGLATLDPRPAFKAAFEEQPEEPLYFDQEWHLTPHGNRVLARFLAISLADTAPALAGATQAAFGEVEPPAEKGGIPTWMFVFAGLWVVLGSSYASTYKDKESLAKSFLGVGLLLASVFAIVLGGKWLLGELPAEVRPILLLAFVALVLGFVVYKLGRRVGTIAELLKAFTLRGHWYLMPLVIVLLSIGSLLVVAASSPLVAPFIYTLF